MFINLWYNNPQADTIKEFKFICHNGVLRLWYNNPQADTIKEFKFIRHNGVLRLWYNNPQTDIIQNFSSFFSPLAAAVEKHDALYHTTNMALLFSYAGLYCESNRRRKANIL